MFLSSIRRTLANCTFSGNFSLGEGGGIYVYGDNPTITSCTFNGNSADLGGGMNCNMYSDAVVTNCILWGNTATTGDEILTYGGLAIVSYSCIEGGVDGPGVSGTVTDNGGNIGALAADAPLFVNAPHFVDRTTADGTDTTSVTVADATKYAVGEEIEVDFDGVLREVTAAVGTTVTFAGDALMSPSFQFTHVSNWGVGATDLTIELFDLRGRRVATILDQAQTSDRRTWEWNGRDEAGDLVQPGMYIYRARLHSDQPEVVFGTITVVY